MKGEGEVAIKRVNTSWKDVKLLLEHETQLRVEASGQLYDQGITGLAYLRMLVVDNQPQEFVLSAIDRLLNDLRQIAEYLTPTSLSLGMVYAWQAMETEYRREGQAVSVVCEPHCVLEWDSLTAGVRYEVYMIVREAVANALKHGKPPIVVYVECDKTTHILTVRVVDKGYGFNPRDISRHHGLAIMQARARRIRGNLNIGRLQAGMEISLQLAR